MFIISLKSCSGTRTPSLVTLTLVAKKSTPKYKPPKALKFLYLLFKEGPSYEVVESEPDVHLELDKKGKIMGIEIWNAKKSGLITQMEEAITETA